MGGAPKLSRSETPPLHSSRWGDLEWATRALDFNRALEIYGLDKLDLCVPASSTTARLLLLAAVGSALLLALYAVSQLLLRVGRRALRGAVASFVEAPVAYDLPVPAQCRPGWKGKVLEEPSLKVGAFLLVVM